MLTTTRRVGRVVPAAAAGVAVISISPITAAAIACIALISSSVSGRKSNRSAKGQVIDKQ
jgi:hypothetical protein